MKNAKDTVLEQILKGPTNNILRCARLSWKGKLTKNRKERTSEIERALHQEKWNRIMEGKTKISPYFYVRKSYPSVHTSSNETTRINLQLFMQQLKETLRVKTTSLMSACRVTLLGKVSSFQALTPLTLTKETDSSSWRWMPQRKCGWTSGESPISLKGKMSKASQPNWYTNVRKNRTKGNFLAIPEQHLSFSSMAPSNLDKVIKFQSFNGLCLYL